MVQSSFRAYETANDGVAYSVSPLSSALKKGGIILPKPSMGAITVTDTGNLVKWNNYPANVGALDSIRLYRSISGSAFTLLTTLSKTTLASASNVFVDKITSYGEHVRYYIQTVINNTNDSKQVSVASDTLATYCYLPAPDTLRVGTGGYADTIKISWKWGATDYDGNVDSFILNRYKSGSLEKTYTVAKTPKEMYDTASLINGINYVYSLKSKKNNIPSYLPVISTDSIMDTGYARFAPPDTLFATVTGHSITLSWGYKNGKANMASDVQYLFVRDTSQSDTWQGKIMDTVVTGPDTIYVDNDNLIHGSVRWYKVAAFNDISKEKVLSKPVRGYSILDSVVFTRYDRGVNDSIIVVKWNKLSVHKAFFVEWSAYGDVDANTGKFLYPLDSCGSYSTYTYTTDSAIIPIKEDSLTGRRIFVRVWAKNDFGTSDGALAIGWTKLSSLL